MIAEEERAKFWILFASLASLYGCLIVLGCFKVSKEWRMQFSSRFLLFGMTLYTACFSLCYAVFIRGIRTQEQCDIQAAAVQYFGVGMVMHQAMISYELFKEVVQLTHDAEDPRGPPQSIISENDETDVSLTEMWAQVPRKYWLFELMVLLYNGFFFIVVLLYDNAGPTPGANFSCTISEEGNTLRIAFELFPAYVSCLVVLGCDCMVLHRLFHLLARRDTFFYTATVWGGQRSFAEGAAGPGSTGQPRSPSDMEGMLDGTQTWYLGLWVGNIVDSFSRLDERSRATVLRLMVTPLFYLGLGLLLPVIWLRYPNSIAYVVLTELCGVINAIGWVLLDAPLRRLWGISLRGFYCLRDTDSLAQPLLTVGEVRDSVHVQSETDKRSVSSQNVL